MRPRIWLQQIVPALLASFGLSCSTAFSQQVTGRPPPAMLELDATYVAKAAPERTRTGIPLTLGAALELATARHPVLIAKRKELGIADGELQQASIYFQSNPELSVSVDRRRVPSSWESETSIGRGIEVFPELGYSVGMEQSSSLSPSEKFTEFEVELSQEFEVFGQPRARRRAAEASREAVLADIAATTWEVLADVRSEFYTAQIASRRVQLAEEQFAFGNAVLELSKRQLDAGDIAPTEYRQLEIQMASLRTKLLSARAEVASALDTLQLSLGYGPSDSIEFADELHPPAKIPLSPEEFLSEVLEIYPRLYRARLITEQREREFTLVKKQGKPNVTGSLFVGREDDDEKIYGIGLAIPLPLFNRNQGSSAAAKAAIDLAEAEMRSLESAVRTQARTAIMRLAISEEEASYYYDEILPAIQTNLQQLENTFRQGEISMIELRINQRDLLDAQTAALDALGEYYEQRAHVEGLLGRSLSGSVSNNTQEDEDPSDAH